MSAIASLELRPLSRLMKALGDETRLRMVALLAHGELCVCHLEGALGLTQSNTSRQLAVLRAAGVVEARREGGWVHYRLVEHGDGLTREQLRQLVRTFGKNEVLRADVRRLLKARGPGACK
jgi:ArsR family transcriptional regulator